MFYNNDDMIHKPSGC